MEAKSNFWGRKIDYYSTDFELDAAGSSGDLSASNFSGPWQEIKVLPMTLLENTLSRCDLKQGYCYGDRPLVALLLTLRNYHRANTSRIFKYYYGFLCIRCIIHIVCIGLLLEMGTLDIFLASLDQNLDWKQVCSSIAHETMRQIESAIRSDSEPATCARFEAIFRGQNVLPSVGGIAASDCTFVQRLLWEDRASSFNLCERGLLPGYPTLLYTISRIILAQPMTSADLQPEFLQDLCIRQYLSSSDREKYALRVICRSAAEKAPKAKPIFLGEVDLEDIRALARAYIRLLSLQDSSHTCFQTVDWDAMRMVLSHVMAAVRRDSATKQEGLVILEKTISFLWLILAKKINQLGYVCSLSDSHNIWMYFSIFFGSMRMLQNGFAGSHEAELKFAQMLVDSDVLALAGRVLLLMSEEGNQFNDLDRMHWSVFVRGFPQLCTMFKKSIPVAPHLFTDSTTTWAKVFDQLALPARLGTFNMVDGDPKLVGCTVEMMQAWAPLGELFHANSLPQPQPCAYPRCFQPFTHEKTLGVRYLCGKCGKVAYCNLNCQRAHWQLETVDSHRLECIP